jgi:hypothetical protein
MSARKLKRTYWKDHARLWKKLVPLSGPAKTVQGEVIRIVGKLTNEAYRNGNANWSRSCTLMWRFVGKTLEDPETFSPKDRAKVKEWVATIIRDRDCPDLSRGRSPFYRLTEKAVIWCFKHPKLIPYTPNPRIQM